MQEEIWKKVKGFEGCYEVSNLGRVKSLHSNKILKPRKSRRSDAYICLAVALYKRGKRTDELISRLVATAFCPNPKHKKCVNHIDFNPENNHASNLEWVTYRENSIHSQNAGRLARTSPEKIEIIKYLVKNNFSFHEIARLYNCETICIKDIYNKYCI